MTRPHIKQFQVSQYKVSEERIKRGGLTAWVYYYHNNNPTVRDRKFKRYQII